MITYVGEAREIDTDQGSKTKRRHLRLPLQEKHLIQEPFISRINVSEYRAKRHFCCLLARNQSVGDSLPESSIVIWPSKLGQLSLASDGGMKH